MPIVYYTVPNKSPLKIADLKLGWNLGVSNGYRSGAAPENLRDYAPHYNVTTNPVRLRDFIGHSIIIDVDSGGTQN